MIAMTVTIELPGEELVEMAPRYHSLRQGKTIENYCIEPVLCSLESEGDKKIEQILKDWLDQVCAEEEAAAA